MCRAASLRYSLASRAADFTAFTGSAGGAGLAASGGGGAGFGAGAGATGAGGGVGLGGGAGWYSGTGSDTGAGGLAFCLGAMAQPARKTSNKPMVAREVAFKSICVPCDVGLTTPTMVGI